MTADEDIIDFVIEKHGSVINVEEHPEVLIDIIRRFRADDGPPDGGQPCGGVPAPPPPPPSSEIETTVSLDDVMRQLLAVARDVDAIKEQLGGGSASG
jgi:hypothetical protein